MTLVLKAALLLVFLGIVTRSNAQGLNCTTVSDGINACTTSLRLGANPRLGNPSRECCVGLQNVTAAAITNGVSVTCQCLSTSPPLNGLTRLQLKRNYNVVAPAFKKCKSTLDTIIIGAGVNLIQRCYAVV